MSFDAEWTHVDASSVPEEWLQVSPGEEISPSRATTTTTRATRTTARTSKRWDAQQRRAAGLDRDVDGAETTLTETTDGTLERRLVFRLAREKRELQNRVRALEAALLEGPATTHQQQALARSRNDRIRKELAAGGKRAPAHMTSRKSKIKDQGFRDMTRRSSQRMGTTNTNRLR